MTPEEAISVSCEHVRHCKKIGMSPAQIIQVFAPSLSRPEKTTWDDAVWAIARVYQELPGEDEERWAA